MPLRTLLTALALALGLVSTTLTTPATAGDSDYGRTWRKDGTLRQGCHGYRFASASVSDCVDRPSQAYLG